MKLFLLSAFLLTFCFYSHSQSDHFQIELESFSPDVALVIEMLENNKAEPFDGTATNGSKLIFEEIKGKPMLFWFWDVRDVISIGQIDGLNLMHQIFGADVHFIGFAYDKKPFIDDFQKGKQIDFPILPNAFRLGELHYGSELGQGRVFLIDRSGILQKAIPRAFFVDNNNSFSQLRSLISNIINE